jgi:threonine synthase
MNYVSHLECAHCGVRYEAGLPHNLCLSCARPLWVRYDLEALKKTFTRNNLLGGRPPSLWRYMELLPIRAPDKIVSLGETMTPILETKRIAAHFGVNCLYVKDESRLPTGTFKARGMAMAVSMANEFSIHRVAVPTAGNAGGAMAAYAARAGMEAYVFMPEDASLVNLQECQLAGAKTFLVNGLISDCGRIVTEGTKSKGWFDLSTLKEPYRLEGKKTMGLELAEQFDWELPDVIMYPTGGGTGLIGMWKAFDELNQLGWLKSPKMPKMISCQSDGCAPIVTAFNEGERFARPFENAATMAGGIRVPAAVGDFMILAAIRQSGGVAVATPEADIPKWMGLVSSQEGISICPETAVCFGALENLLQREVIKSSDCILVFNTAAAHKYTEITHGPTRHLDIARAIDWAGI